jgi:hypothetical protein
MIAAKQWPPACLRQSVRFAGLALRCPLRGPAEEVLFKASRPTLLNGIEHIGRPDLADRAIFLSLGPIGEEQRRSATELWREFELARPAILGVLLDAVAHGLRTVVPFTLLGCRGWPISRFGLRPVRDTPLARWHFHSRLCRQPQGGDRGRHRRRSGRLLGAGDHERAQFLDG